MLGRFSLAAAIAAIALGVGLSGAKAEDAMARMHDLKGNSVGTVALTETPNGTLLHARLAFMPAGTHAFHVHAIGKCRPPFKSAGGHFNPTDTNHGLMDADGMHAGDMPNIHVPNTGVLEIEVLNRHVSLNDALFDDDGASIVIHQGADDYKTNPAGAAGSRIACGVIERMEM